MKRLAFFLLLSIPAWAQRDFLTADEADQVREAQEPGARLMLYVKFAQQRVDLIEQALARERSGRSGLIHDTLEQYTSIIEAIDVVADEALHKGKEVLVLGDVAKLQREMQAKLENILASAPKDLPRYKFVLDQAIETTRDSATTSEQDLKERIRNVETREKAIEEERKTMAAPPEKPKTEDTKAAETPGAAPAKPGQPAKPATRKPPTLRRPGEVVPPKPGQPKQ